MKKILLKSLLLLCTLMASSTTWAEEGVTLFHESFGDNSGSAREWKDSYSVKSGIEAVYSGISSYTVSNVKQGKNTTGSTKSGLNQSSQGTDASIIIGPLNVSAYKDLKLTYQWKAASVKNNTYSTSLYYATSSSGSYTKVNGTGTGATTFVECAYDLPDAAAVSTLYLKIVWNTSNTQAIIDEVNLSGTSATVDDGREDNEISGLTDVYRLDLVEDGGISSLTFSATATSEATVLYEIVSTDIDDSDIDLDDNELMVSAPGTTTIRAYVNADDSYKSAEKTFVVYAKGAAEVVVADETINYGSTFTVDASLITGGAITVSSGNTAIATVDGLTITPVAVGSAVITVATAESDTYHAGSETFTLTVGAPAGGTTAVGGGKFTKVTSSEGVTDGEYLIVYEGGKVAFDGSRTTLDATSNTISVSISNNEIEASDKTKAATFTWDAAAKTLKSASGYYIGQTSDANGLASDLSKTYTNAISIDKEGNAVIVSNSTHLMYNSNSDQTRFRYFKSSTYSSQKAIQLYKLNETSLTATLNADGFATYCSEYPLDFSEASDYSAWQVTATEGTTITFEKIEGSIKGGQGILLMGEAGATVTLTSKNSSTELDGNLLVGTLAPTYVTTTDGSNTNFGLSGNTFVKINDGTVKAGKAYLPVPTADVPAGAPLRLVFKNETSGISTVCEAVNDGVFYNLQGMRVAAPTHGIYIVNGKKIYVK